MFQEKLGEIGKDLFQFLGRIERKEGYVLCRFDEKDLTYLRNKCKKIENGGDVELYPVSKDIIMIHRVKSKM